MTHEKALKYFSSFERFGIVPGLERIALLCAELGNPQNDLEFIHVAGTNGKGSTSTMLANVLTCAGFKTGLYTSPYVIDFRERIRVDGEMISGEQLGDIAEKVKSAADALQKKGIQPTEFEVITAAALLFYKEQNCDRVVLETGLGGRFDATNVVENKLACILTSISLDHTDILGDTVAKIAFEKCGIIRTNCPVVVSADCCEEAIKVITEETAKKNCPLHLEKAPKIIRSGLEGTTALFGETEITVPLIGEHMAVNAASVAECARILGISEEHIKLGIEKTRMTARMEIISKEPLVLRDGGHNEGCAERIAQTLDKFCKDRKVIAVCGMMRDKDYASYLDKVAPFCDEIIAVTPSYYRALKAEDLQSCAKRHCENVSICQSPKDGFKTALQKCEKDGIVLVCGSFYMMSDIFEV